MTVEDPAVLDQKSSSPKIDPVTLDARAESTDIMFWVVARGQGLNADQRRLLNEGFSGQAADPGEGFGLLFVRLVVASRGGRVRLDSSPGKGCTVTVTLLSQI